MKVYHQTGFRYQWNIECFQNGVGDGIIFSPINIDADKLLAIDDKVKSNGFLDPQLYLLNEAKGTLDTYPYFPGNLKPDFSTPDLDDSHLQLAKLCVDFQLQNNFHFLTIPTRYYSDNPSSFFEQSTEYFIIPFIEYVEKQKIKNEILLSVIIKPIMLTDEEKRNEVLNWITGHQKVDGVYLIFENNFPSKQIKDFEYLFYALKFIRILKDNQMQVHIGYNNTEGLLYSIAMPDSVTVGSYENLRSFGIKRFQDLENGPMRAPRARLYSSKLFQWMDYQYIDAMRQMIPDYQDFFDDSEYRPLMFKPEYNWHFQKSEPYKHYFTIFNKQIENLPYEQKGRINFLKLEIKNAISRFKEIENTVLLDEDSDGSHLPTWYNVIVSFQKELTK